MKINKPLALSEQGRRDNQEDSVWPSVGTASESTRTFVVCDGMGGHESGEVASNAVCSAIAGYVAERPQDPINPAQVEQAIARAYDMLDRVDTSDASRHMGTTLTLLTLTDSEVVCAHIGDSRIYQVRPSAGGSASIVYKSSDHSLVNELVKAKVITAEEALTHPKKNVITRAMQSVEGRRDPATLRRTNDVASGDYFLMCSDGVTEAVSDQAICDILGDPTISDSEKLEKFKSLCLSSSHDNFSLYLVPIAKGIQADTILDETLELMIHLPGEPPLQTEKPDNSEIAEAIDDEVIAELQHAETSSERTSSKSATPQFDHSRPKTQTSISLKKIAIAMFGVLLVCAGIYFAFILKSKNSESPTRQPQPKVEHNESVDEKQTSPATETNADGIKTDVTPREAKQTPPKRVKNVPAERKKVGADAGAPSRVSEDTDKAGSITNVQTKPNDSDEESNHEGGRGMSDV